MDFKIIALGDGPLVGFQYIPSSGQEDDWTEFNIYLLLFCFRLERWYYLSECRALLLRDKQKFSPDKIEDELYPKTNAH